MHTTALQHTATRCNTLQHTAIHCVRNVSDPQYAHNANCNMPTNNYTALQYTAALCNTLAANFIYLFNVVYLMYSNQWMDGRVLQCVAACCSVLQRVTVCCSVLQRVAACCNVLQCVASFPKLSISYIATNGWMKECCSMLQCAAVCCSVLQCVAVCCELSKVVYLMYYTEWMDGRVLQCVAVCCSVLPVFQSGDIYHIRHTGPGVCCTCPCIFQGLLKLSVSFAKEPDKRDFSAKKNL